MTKAITFDVSDEAIEAARKRAQRYDPGPLVKEAKYLERRDVFALKFDNGVETIIPRRLLQGLADFKAGDACLSHIVILAGGEAIEWPEPDIAFSVAGLLSGSYGGRAWMREMQQKGGRVRSERKAESSRENGRKGGRPCKKAA